MLLWKGESHPVGTLGGKEFVVSDAARALGYTVASDPSTGVLTLTGQGHQILLGPGTAQVPVDRRIIPISLPARVVGGALYAPADFFEKVLFPLAGATGSYDAAKRVWTLTAAGPPPLSIEVAVVHVAPTTQVVLRLSGAAKTATALSERGFAVRFADTRLDPPWPEKKFDDPLVAAVRFFGDTTTVEFREPNLAARAYPLTSPDRLVIEVGRKAAAAAAPVEPAAPAPGADPAADGGRRPRARRRRDRGHRAGRAPGEGSDAPDREEARRHAAEGSFVPDRAHAGLGRPDPARRPRLDREPREGGPVPLRPRQLLARGCGQGIRDVLPLARGVGQDRPGGRQGREPGGRGARDRPGATRPAITTSTSSCGTSPRART